MQKFTFCSGSHFWQIFMCICVCTSSSTFNTRKTDNLAQNFASVLQPWQQDYAIQYRKDYVPLGTVCTLAIAKSVKTTNLIVLLLNNPVLMVYCVTSQIATVNIFANSLHTPPTNICNVHSVMMWYITTYIVELYSLISRECHEHLREQ